MTDTEINVAIAEACGWKYHDWSHHQMPYWTDRDGRAIGIPDYCNDLNEMHEAEACVLLGKVGWVHYSHVLLQDAIHATARQRAEAFLRTIGKWRDE